MGDDEWGRGEVGGEAFVLMEGEHGSGRWIDGIVEGWTWDRHVSLQKFEECLLDGAEGG